MSLLLLLLLLLLLAYDIVVANFVCLPYHDNAYNHWRQCYDSCCSQVCDLTQNYRACGYSKLNGHCNFDSDCEGNLQCSNEWHQFDGLDASGYCKPNLPTKQPSTSPPTPPPQGNHH